MQNKLQLDNKQHQLLKVLPQLRVQKVKGGVIALNGGPFQSYGASPAVWHPTVLPATRHR